MGAISEAAKTFLTRKVVMDHEIVTYRVLSRELSVHVNQAKKWLEDFLNQSAQSEAPLYATYIISGEALPTPAKDVNGNPVEDEEEGASGDSQASSSSFAIPSVSTWQILLAPAEDLEQCKGRFVRISSTHVYSLSPASLKNPALLITTATIVRQRDSSVPNPLEHAKAIGMTLNPNWNLQTMPGPSKAKATRSMPPPPVPAAASKRGKEKDEKQGQEEEERGAAAPTISKKPGTLDWGKAKVKSAEPSISAAPAIKSKLATNDQKREAKRGAFDSDIEVTNPKSAVKAKTDPEEKSAPAKKSNLSADSSGSKLKPSPFATTPVTQQPSILAEKPSFKPSDMQGSRGTARVKKRVLMSDTEEEEEEDERQSSASTGFVTNKSRASLTNANKLDIGDEDAAAPKKKRKRMSAVSTKPTKSDRVMLESDSEVERSQSSASESEPEHVPLSAAEARRTLKGPKKEKEMDIDALARKEKRVREKTAKGPARSRVPKGKRRAQKERTFVNERGRTVTEDYWTLESASGSGEEGIDTDNDSKSANKASSHPKESREDVATVKNNAVPKAKARASSARETDADDGPPKTKRKSEATSESKDATKDIDKTASKGSAATKSSAKSAPPLSEKKTRQQTLAGFFKK